MSSDIPKLCDIAIDVTERNVKWQGKKLGQLSRNLSKDWYGKKQVLDDASVVIQSLSIIILCVARKTLRT
ncbi:MAG: hypothetical protein BA871_03730 [Desulfuromonadales bacterium C00003096]|nr:MAG: hypothetical protein BA871_03730 [Desulfuromonadales bacterium C00003096]RCV62871.1 hypothetical protein C5S53_16650 [Methanophagales archaeon]